MKRLVILTLGIATALPTTALAKRCPTDSVQVGSSCIDTYEASVWNIPLTDPGGGSNKSLIKKVQKGKASVAALLAGGATQRGVNGVADYPCVVNGSNCKDQIYAVSVAGIAPSGGLSWFQANMACGNSLKRLPSNAEWQMAATGTPDPGTDDGINDCKLHFGGSADDPVPSGSRVNCVSAWAAHDMVGNVLEWVADWTQRSPLCTGPGWSGGGMNNDLMCLFDVEATVRLPGALLRGGRYGNDGDMAGYFAITADVSPTATSVAGGPKVLGFRCAR